MLVLIEAAPNAVISKWVRSQDSEARSAIVGEMEESSLGTAIHYRKIHEGWRL